MGKVQQFFIQLEKQNAVYFAGEWVKGQVIVHLSDQMKMRGIHLAFKGEAYVHWTETETVGTGQNRRTQIKHFTAKEPYFNQSVVLFGKAMGRMVGDNPVLQPGQYIYPFQFCLPHNLPSSFEGGVGHIRYQLRAIIDMPWQFDHITKRPFTVVARVDLNQIPNAHMPQEGSDDKMVCCLCCASGPITAHMRLDRSGYVPGEYIVMSGEVDNESSRQVRNIRFKLEMRTTFYARGKSKENWKTISEIRRSGIGPESRDTFTGLSLLIPPLPPSYLGGCRIIDITYVLKLAVSPSGPSMTLDVPMEVIIGTIPLRNVPLSFVQNPFQPILYDQNAWINAPPSMPSAPPGEALPSYPPPAYEECFWGRTSVKDEDDNEHTSGPKEWAPAYPYYSWGNNPSAPPLPPADDSHPPSGGDAYQPPAGAAYQPAGAAYQPAGAAQPPAGAAYQPQDGAGYQPPPGGANYQPQGGAGYQPPPGGANYQPQGGAGYQPPPGGANYQPQDGAGYQPPPGGANYQPPGGASYPQPAGSVPQQPPAYNPPGGFAPPPAGYAGPPSGSSDQHIV